MRSSIPACARSAAFLLVLIVFATCAAPRAGAQTLYGTLVGNVTDPSNAAISGAKVVAVNTGTGFSRETSTDERGGYLFSDLQPGAYRITVTAAGFAGFTQTDAQVSTNAVLRVDVRLQLPTATESVTVAAAITALQSDRSDVRAEISGREYRDLPVPGARNYQALFKLVPGFTPPRRQNSIVSTPQEGLVANVNGTTKSTNNTRIDGASNAHIWLPQHSAYMPPLEAIENVNVVTNSMDAEQGLAGGAAINVSMKSGTNSFHGVAFNYHQNSAIKAKNVFFTEAKIPKYIQNQYGGTLGGPVVKNKLFFFGSYEGTARRWNVSRFVTVPTADQREGNFSAYGTTLYDPLTGAADGSGRSIFPNAIIPASRHSRVSRQLIDWLPLPTHPERLTNNYFASAPGVFNRDSTDAKVNWNASANLTMFGRFSILNFDITSPTPFNEASGGPIESGQQAGYGYGRIVTTTYGANYIVSPTLLVDGNFGFTRMAPSVTPFQYGQNIGLDVLKIPGTNGPDPLQSGIPHFAISGYENLGNTGSANPYFWRDNQFQYNLNTTWIKGGHSVRFGLDVTRQHMNHTTSELDASPRGRFDYGGGPTALRGGASPNQFNSFATFLLGLTTAVGTSAPMESPITTRNWSQGYYVRDQWQATRNLTLTLGLRYEYYPMPTRANRGMELYDPDTNMMLIGGVGSVPKGVGVEMSRKLFAPRAGIAYRIGQKWVVRSGFGINTDPYPLARPLRTNYPILISMTIPAANTFQYVGRTEDGIPPIVFPDLASGIIPIPGTVTLRTLDKKFERGYVESFNFTVQRELKFGFVGQAAYVGTRGIRQQAYQELNWAEPGAGTAGRALNRRFGRTANTTLVTPFGTANYNALQAQLTRRFANGFQAQVSYTFSKAIAFNDEVDSSLFFNAPSALARNRALTNYDRPHNLQAAWAAELPFGRGKPWGNQGGVAGALLGGWQLNGIFSSYSGNPFTVTSAGTSLNAPGNSQTADQIKPEVRILGGAGPGQAYFDPLAYAPVTAVRFGTSGLNALRGPGVVNLDLGLFREFSATERVKIQFRAEAFNATNTPHFNNPGTNVSNLRLNSDGSVSNLQGFSEITSAQDDERQFRFGLRVSF
jgi:hypothetical protein